MQERAILLDPGNQFPAGRAERIQAELVGSNPARVNQARSRFGGAVECQTYVSGQTHAVLGDAVLEGSHRPSDSRIDSSQTADPGCKIVGAAGGAPGRIRPLNMKRGKFPELLPEPPTPALDNQNTLSPDHDHANLSD